MNEIEKMELPEEQTSAQSPEVCGATPVVDAVESESICSETESPAMDLAEAAEISKIQDLHKLSKDELVEKLKDILANNDMQAHRDVTLMKQAFFYIRKHETDEEANKFVEDGNNIDDFVPSPCALENEFKELMTEFKSRRAGFLEKEEETRQENLAKKLRAIDAIKALMEDVDNINRNYQEFQRLQQEFKEIKDIPQQAETEVWKQFQTVVEQFYDLLKLNKELRDLDFKKNLESKRELIRQAVELAEVPDVVDAARKLQDLHNQWREIGPVAKDIRDEIWEEFRSASATVNRRHQEYFLQRKANEQKNEEAKNSLCERMEAIVPAEIKTFADWEKTTEEVKALQAEWRTLGYASRKANNTLFARFRKSIDDFFAAKSEFYQKVRDEFKENLRKKTELCEKAEALADMENSSEAVRQIKKLQDEWKTIGSVDRRQSDIVWRRFMKACNAAYDRRRKENDSRHSEEKANLEVKTRIVADLKALAESDAEGSEAQARLRELQDEWRATGHVPFSKKEELNNEYFDLARSLNDKLNPRRGRDGARQRSAGRISSNLSPRDQLLERIRLKKADLLTYENNMGFFNVKSAAGNSMVAELQRKIERIKNDIASLNEELKALDAAPEE